MKKCITFLVLLLNLSLSNAQEDDVLKQLLRGKNNLTDIMNTVKQYYNNPETVNRLGSASVKRALKHWQRYEWYMSSRLGPNGEFVNINQKLFDATSQQQNRTSFNGNNITNSSSAAWIPLGPMNTTEGIGRADRLAFHPTDANTVFVGTTAGGLWKTTDAGTNWTCLTPDVPAGGISGIAINPDDTDSIYILTGDGDSDAAGLVKLHGYMRLSIGVLRSADGGATWRKMGEFPGVDYSTLVGYRLVMHPTNNNILYACTNQGLFMSINAGETWGLNNSNGRFYNLKFKPGSGNICYAVSRISNDDTNRTYFWRSTNSGIISWDSINAVNNQINSIPSRTDLAVAASNSNVVYLLTGGSPANGQFSGLYRSDDSGLSFDLQSNSPNILGRADDGTDNFQQSWYDHTVAVSNTTSATVVVGGVELWRSLNSGETWAFRGALHDDVHEIAFHPVGNKLWAATDGGVYSSEDNGFTWTTHFEDMNTTQFYRMAVHPDDYVQMIAGAQDNAVKRRTSATSDFDAIAGADGFTVAYDLFNPDTMYAILNQGISRSVNGGNSFSGTSPANSNNPFSMAMAVHTSITGGVFISSDSTWRSTNTGTNWIVTPNLQMGWCLRTCPSNGNRVYGAGGNAYSATSGFIRRSDNGGVNWSSNLNTGGNGLPFNLPQKVTSINVDPNNSNNVWVTFGGFTDGFKVFFSDDAGVTWFPRNGTLPNVPINCIALDINNNAYIGTDNGVYYRSTSMTDWVPFYNNLPYVPVTDLVISEAEGRIRAATFGRGIWSSDLYSTCVANLNITGTLEGQEFHEASNNVSSTAALLTSEGTKVQMRGGNEVLLQPGFTARETTQFRALIGPCGSGGVAGMRVAEVGSSTKLEPKSFLPPQGGKKAMVHINSANRNSISFLIQQKVTGIAEVILTDENGAVVKQMENLSSATGNNNFSMSAAGLASGLYYLNLLIDKRREHIQEVMIQ